MIRCGDGFRTIYPFAHMFVYFIGPAIGGVAGVFAYRYLAPVRAVREASYRGYEVINQLMRKFSCSVSSIFSMADQIEGVCGSVHEVLSTIRTVVQRNQDNLCLLD